ncbi:MAG: hypothetical protein GF332_04500 [Candidatus Moranbacteria bacterium]|nr:hypothetical protein [Candidatus Moranbacteria bacterium]
MSKIVELNQFKSGSGSLRKRTIKQPMRFGVVSVGFVTILIIFILSLVYLMQANRTATYGFEIDKYNERLQELEKEREKIEIEAARLKSTNEIKSNLDKLNFLQVDQTKVAAHYITKELAEANNKDNNNDHF